MMGDNACKVPERSRFCICICIARISQLPQQEESRGPRKSGQW